MCKYACSCRHRCAQADECFIVGWPCLNHNDEAVSAFSDGDIKSRDQGFAAVSVSMRKLLERSAGTATGRNSSLQTFIRNKLDRHATGRTYNVPQAQDNNPKSEPWRSAEFEEYIADLLAYYEIQVVKQKATMTTSEDLAEAEHTKEESTCLSAIDVHDEVQADPQRPVVTRNENRALVDDGFLQKPPAWQPSKVPEISLLLKTEIDFEEEWPENLLSSSPEERSLVKPNPFRQREVHSLERASFYKSTESLAYVPVNSSTGGLNRVDELLSDISLVEELEETQSEISCPPSPDLVETDVESSDNEDEFAMSGPFSRFGMATQLTARAGRMPVLPPKSPPRSKTPRQRDSRLSDRDTHPRSVSRSSGTTQGTSSMSSRSTQHTSHTSPIRPKSGKSLRSKEAERPQRTKQRTVPKYDYDDFDSDSEADVFDTNAHDAFLEIADEL